MIAGKTKMTVSAIAAMAKNRVIGAAGGLPWKIPEDFKFFKTKTMGHIMIMGRKTYESMGTLPGRLSIVITKQKDFQPEGILVVAWVEAALSAARERLAEWDDEVFVVGGGEIYSLMLPYTDIIYLTEIHQDFAGDARFPEFDKSVFRETARSSRQEPLSYDFVTYTRVSR